MGITIQNPHHFGLIPQGHRQHPPNALRQNTIFPRKTLVTLGIYGFEGNPFFENLLADRLTDPGTGANGRMIIRKTLGRSTKEFQFAIAPNINEQRQPF